MKSKIKSKRLHPCLGVIRLKVKGYIKHNRVFPFIIGFVVFLFSAAILNVANYSKFAEDLAILAYFSLFAGVSVKLVTYLKEQILKNGVF
jgi:ABC-type Mn2+/Zn2+ transport system permease subunit